RDGEREVPGGDDRGDALALVQQAVGLARRRLHPVARPGVEPQHLPGVVLAEVDGLAHVGVGLVPRLAGLEALERRDLGPPPPPPRPPRPTPGPPGRRGPGPGRRPRPRTRRPGPRPSPGPRGRPSPSSPRPGRAGPRSAPEPRRRAPPRRSRRSSRPGPRA